MRLNGEAADGGEGDGATVTHTGSENSPIGSHAGRRGSDPRRTNVGAKVIGDGEGAEEWHGIGGPITTLFGILHN